MDLVLDWADNAFLTEHVYPSSMPADHIGRQCLSLFMITMLGGYVLYLSFAWFSYVFLFDKAYEKHPKFLKNQVRMEIQVSCGSIPFMTLLTLPVFLAEVRGYSFLYNDIEEYGYAYLAFSIVMFMFFNDMMIYWIHRFLHHTAIYKHIHKLHHKWLVPTPFASHAFHPVDGFLQSTPYHMFVFLMPLHKLVYLGLFVLVNFWTISIHDGNFFMDKMPKWFEAAVNGAAHHTDHHLFFDYNYGQYFTLWDHIGGSYRNPSPFEHKGPLDDVKRMKARSISAARPFIATVSMKDTKKTKKKSRGSDDECNQVHAKVKPVSLNIRDVQTLAQTYKLNEAQCRVYDAFSQLLSQFDTTIMLDILEDVLHDAQQKTLLEDYLGVGTAGGHHTTAAQE
ncbi:Aste57867_18106 [Aphanomyces stellatus]|uniref:Aste57867_18106 protein n=1 Tax=Aphanomyces stellatus TaxID=120398 RepID=A0A485L9V6_9STRA|nr:hypothetical protein As57867_018044 [Aphanomyces stellatus]VFT94844.1 Aste57867_18106 [Aphanomyces stellatus]